MRVRDFGLPSCVLVMALFGLMMSGCTVMGSLAPGGTKPPQTTAPEPVVTPTETAKPSTPKGGKEPVYGAAAVVELMKRARQLSAQGDSVSAGATIERALRIEPQNPALWYNLAVNHYQLKIYDQCENAGLKSLSFISSGHSLYAQNWRLIGECRAQRGDAAGAVKARQKLK